MTLAPHPLAVLSAPFSSPALRVETLTLVNFRNYREQRLETGGRSVLLTGPNGGGKTNVLEALSLLVPGRGLCRAAPSEWQNAFSGGDPWAVAARLCGPLGPAQLGTGRDPESGEGERRAVHIDGRAVKNQQALADHVALAWVTPEMDRVLSDGPAARRKWLDRMAYSFDPAHAGRVTRYERAMRERLRLLREGVADAAWLSGLEDDMSRTGVAIAAARGLLVRQLRSAMLETESAFPQAALSLHGLAEEGLETTPALLVEDHLRAALARTRGEDAQSGTTSIGPHRSDLRVVHKARACPAELCSTGEQKALVIAISLAYVRTLTLTRGMAPVLLLDDITAHLDVARRIALFEEIGALGAQAWVTGTDPDVFAPFERDFCCVQVQGGAFFTI